MTVIHNCDPCTDLLHFFHIMGSVNDGGTLFIQLLNAFQDFVPALGVNGYRWLIHNNREAYEQFRRQYSVGGEDRLRAFLDAFSGNR